MATYYRYLGLSYDDESESTIVNKVGVDCTPGSDRCVFLQQNANFLQCYMATPVGGSIVVLPPSDICYGSRNLKIDPTGIVVYHFSGTGCPTDLNQEPTTILTIRGWALTSLFTYTSHTAHQGSLVTR